MAHILIVDGLDKLGKTTLCRLIEVQNTPVWYRRIDLAHTKTLEELRHWSRAELESWSQYGLDDLVLYDRFPMVTDLAYDNKLSLRESLDWAMMLNRYHVRIAYLEPIDLDTYLDRLAQEPDEYFDMSNRVDVEEKLRRYDAYLAAAPLTVMRLALGQCPGPAVAEMVAAFAFGRITYTYTIEQEVLV